MGLVVGICRSCNRNGIHVDEEGHICEACSRVPSVEEQEASENPNALPEISKEDLNGSFLRDLVMQKRK